PPSSTLPPLLPCRRCYLLSLSPATTFAVPCCPQSLSIAFTVPCCRSRCLQPSPSPATIAASSHDPLLPVDSASSIAHRQ
ncbi:hypothetical protein BHE74_00046511, partial [Ensete ventricosum]